MACVGRPSSDQTHINTKHQNGAELPTTKESDNGSMIKMKIAIVMIDKTIDRY